MDTTPPLPDTWHSREFPVLREVVRISDERYNSFVSVEEIADATGLSVDDVTRAGLALANDGLVKTIGDGGQLVSDFREPSARARRLTGAWPTPQTALDRMIDALEAIAANTEDPEERTRAQKFAEWLRTGATTVGLSVASAALTGQIS